MGVEAIRELLQGLGIEAESLREVPIEGAPEVALGIDSDPTRWFATWQRLRAVVGTTGMWPVATWDLDRPEQVIRFEVQGPDGLDASPAAIIARVPQVDVDGLLATTRAQDRQRWEQWDETDSYLEWMVQDAELEGVDVAKLHRELDPCPDPTDVERWLLDIELERGLDTERRNDRYLDWFVPSEAVILLLPTTIPWHAGAYLGGYAWGYPHTDLRTALLRRWYNLYGAELAANWGTMQQFVVTHPPATIQQAWPAAYEISLLWPDTIHGPVVPLRRLARDLVDRPTWFLHHRP